MEEQFIVIEEGSLYNPNFVSTELSEKSLRANNKKIAMKFEGAAARCLTIKTGIPFMRNITSGSDKNTPIIGDVIPRDMINYIGCIEVKIFEDLYNEFKVDTKVLKAIEQCKSELRVKGREAKNFLVMIANKDNDWYLIYDLINYQTSGEFYVETYPDGFICISKISAIKNLDFLFTCTHI